MKKSLFFLSILTLLIGVIALATPTYQKHPFNNGPAPNYVTGWDTVSGVNDTFYSQDMPAFWNSIGFQIQINDYTASGLSGDSIRVYGCMGPDASWGYINLGTIVGVPNSGYALTDSVTQQIAGSPNYLGFNGNPWRSYMFIYKNNSGNNYRWRVAILRR